MRPRNICASLVLACLLALGGTALGAEATDPAPEANAPPAETQAVRRTKRVALIPLIDRTGWLTKSAAESLTDRMDRELHIPLNDTMHWAEFLNEDETAAALKEALAAQGKKAKPELAAREVAQKLDADLVLFLVVNQFYQHIFHSIFFGDGELYIESAASVVVYGYDARHDRLIKAPASRFEHTEYLPAYEAEVLALEALDEALREANAKSAIFPLSEDDGAPAAQTAQRAQN
ncbi:MAG: hypothetical protein IKW79_06750 [Schwartzia sp.]|nr:hypothetical protein [Schwartzia sp. (in: firmicutes)]